MEGCFGSLTLNLTEFFKCHRRTQKVKCRKKHPVFICIGTSIRAQHVIHRLSSKVQRWGNAKLTYSLPSNRVKLFFGILCFAPRPKQWQYSLSTFTLDSRAFWETTLSNAKQEVGNAEQADCLLVGKRQSVCAQTSNISLQQDLLQLQA